jgi:proline iminopeptidase
MRVLAALLLLSGALACTPSTPAPAPPPAPIATPAPVPVPVEPRTAPRPNEGKVDVGTAGSLWYHILGTGSDTVLVPLGSYLEESLSAIARARTVIFYDPRHRGRSDAFTDTTLSRFDADVSDMEAVRAALGVSRMSVIGFSYYGAVAAAYAASNPSRVARLVLLSPIEPNDSLAASYAPPERMTRIDTTRARQLLKLRAAGADTADPAGYCQAYWQLNAPLFVGDPAHASRISPTWCPLANESPRAMGDHLRRSLASLSAGELTDVARRVTVPTLVVVGDRDLVANPAGGAAWAAAMRNARVWTVRGAGHFAWLEERDAVVRALERFLGGEWP